jgi:hypothetical protein
MADGGSLFPCHWKQFQLLHDIGSIGQGYPRSGFRRRHTFEMGNRDMSMSGSNFFGGWSTLRPRRRMPMRPSTIAQRKESVVLLQAMNSFRTGAALWKTEIGN